MLEQDMNVSIVTLSSRPKTLTKRINLDVGIGLMSTLSFLNMFDVLL